MIALLYRRYKTYIDSLEFKSIKRTDGGDEALRITKFTNEEIVVIKKNNKEYIARATAVIHEECNLTKIATAYYLRISILTRLRRGEKVMSKNHQPKRIVIIIAIVPSCQTWLVATASDKQ